MHAGNAHVQQSGERHPVARKARAREVSSSMACLMMGSASNSWSSVCVTPQLQQSGIRRFCVAHSGLGCIWVRCKQLVIEHGS
jgi:hypothetical protein